MTNIEAIHDLTGLILTAQGKIERLEYLLKEIAVSAKKFSAKVTLEMDQLRSSYIQYLTKEEIQLFLQRKLQEESLTLSALQERFNIEHK